MTKSRVSAMLCGGVVAGTLDLLAAALINWRSPFIILQAVARGVLGEAAYTGGAASALLGMLLQWTMSVLIAAIFVGAAVYLPVLRKRWIAAGLAYGVVVFLVMNYVVMPLSMVGSIPHYGAASFALNMLAMLLFGLIVAYCAQRFAAESSFEQLPNRRWG